jgi:radical SAM protein with 4Fe4S-binding SPASM domain
MGLSEMRRRLPVVESLPAPDSRRVLTRRAGEAPTPRYAVWELTLRCDQKCIHCGSRAGAARPGELSTEECLDVVTQLRELGVGEVTIIGGEAYLRSDFILIIRAIREAGMAATMTTGGLHLSPARAEAMVEAGIVSVAVSIDGMQEEHDRLRGIEGSWDRALRAIENLRRAGARVSVNTQINALTLPRLPELLERIAEAGVFGWQLQITSPFGNAGDRPEILLQPYRWLELFETLDRLTDRCAALGIMVWPGNNLGYFGPVEAKLRARQRRGAHYGGCAAGRMQIGLEADGSVKGCPSLGGPQNVGGNVREHSLREIWERTEQLAYIRERTRGELWGYCAECYYADVCRGGCTATAEPLMGRPGNNPFCHHRALELDRIGYRERIELVRRGPGQPFDHGYYRIVREPKDPARRSEPGVVTIDEPRVPRTIERMGAGRPLTERELATPPEG